MNTLDGTLRPVELEYNPGEFMRELNDPQVIGFCFRYSGLIDGFPTLATEKVILNATTGIARPTGSILSIAPIQLALRGMNNRNTFYRWAVFLERVALFSHIDFSLLNTRDNFNINGNTAGSLQRIKDFDFVFVNADILRYFSSINPDNLYVSLAVADFFIADDQMGSYQTLKFSPYPQHEATYDGNIIPPTAYYLAPSCPPMWREQFVYTISNALDPQKQLFITMGEIIDAYEKIGIKITAESAKNTFKAGGPEGLSKNLISKIKALLFSE
jgi:hypothetical protein